MSDYERRLDFFIHNVICMKVAEKVKAAKNEMSFEVQCYLIERDLIPTKLVETISLLAKAFDSNNTNHPLRSSIHSIYGVPILVDKSREPSINGQDNYLAFGKFIVPEFTKVAAQHI